jgi:hypothetical protein
VVPSPSSDSLADEHLTWNFSRWRGSLNAGVSRDLTQSKLREEKRIVGARVSSANHIPFCSGGNHARSSDHSERLFLFGPMRCSCGQETMPA